MVLTRERFHRRSGEIRAGQCALGIVLALVIHLVWHNSGSMCPRVHNRERLKLLPNVQGPVAEISTFLLAVEEETVLAPSVRGIVWPRRVKPRLCVSVTFVYCGSLASVHSQQVRLACLHCVPPRCLCSFWGCS